MFTASLVHEAVGYKEMGNYDRKYSILTYMTLVSDSGSLKNWQNFIHTFV